MSEMTPTLTESMLADAIAKIEGLACKAYGLEVIERAKDGHHVVYASNGKLGVFELPAPRAEPEIDGLSSLVALCKDKVIAPDPEVYHNTRAIVVVLDRKNRRSCATMQLIPSVRFKQLVELTRPTSLDIPDAVRLLRYKLHDTGIDDLVSKLRRVDFKRGGGAAMTVEHGKESFGESVEMEVQQRGDIPDQFVVQTQVYMNEGLRGNTPASVNVGLHLNIRDRQVEIGTMSDEIERIMTDVQDWIGLDLQESLPGVPIYAGAP